jgi:hypothetical protein
LGGLRALRFAAPAAFADDNDGSIIVERTGGPASGSNSTIGNELRQASLQP